jgi:multicomponent Na+:H+ antiporter subunit F
MTGFLLGAGVFILLTVLLGLLRVLRGPGDTERVMAAQLLGTGGVAALLLLGSAVDLTAATDLALVLVLLAAFVAVAFVTGLRADAPQGSAPTPPAAGERSGSETG